MTEIGLGYRFQRMKKQEHDKNLDRIYVLACRARKLHKSRDELIRIFRLVLRFEKTVPKLRQFLITSLADQGHNPLDLTS